VTGNGPVYSTLFHHAIIRFKARFRGELQNVGTFLSTILYLSSVDRKQ